MRVNNLHVACRAVNYFLLGFDIEFLRPAALFSRSSDLDLHLCVFKLNRGLRMGERDQKRLKFRIHLNSTH